MLKVGLTGGLATGKSHVGKVLAGFGCHLIRADELGHQLLQPGGGAFDDVVREFGPGILNDQGGIERPRLAAEVFGQPERLARLNAMIHPRVFALEEDQMAAIARQDPRAIAVVEAAILIETGSFRRFQKLILTVCTEEQQIERAMRRDGSTHDQTLARLRHQMPLKEKLPYADYVIDTSGTKEQTFEQTREVYRSLRSIEL